MTSDRRTLSSAVIVDRAGTPAQPGRRERTTIACEDNDFDPEAEFAWAFTLRQHELLSYVGRGTVLPGPLILFTMVSLCENDVRII